MLSKFFNKMVSLFQPAKPEPLWTRSFDAKAGGGNLIQRYHLKENENGSISLERDIIAIETAFIANYGIGYARSSMIGSIPYKTEKLLDTEMLYSNASQAQIVNYLDNHMLFSPIGDDNLAKYVSWKSRVREEWQDKINAIFPQP